MRMGFDWDTSEMSILLLAKLAKPFIGTARIIINSLHLKGDVRKVASLYKFRISIHIFIVLKLSNQIVYLLLAAFLL